MSLTVDLGLRLPQSARCVRVDNRHTRSGRAAFDGNPTTERAECGTEMLKLWR